MKAFIIEDEMFKTATLFVLGCPHEALDAYVKLRFQVTAGLDAGQNGQMLTYDQAPWRVVWVKELPHDVRSFGTLLHEIFHLVTRICQDRGVPIKAQIHEGNGDETAAYLYDFFARTAILKAGITFARGRRRRVSARVSAQRST